MAESAEAVAEVLGQSLTVPVPAGVDLAAARVDVQVHFRDRALFDALVAEHGVEVSEFAEREDPFAAAAIVVGDVTVRLYCRLSASRVGIAVVVDVPDASGVV